ncbi:MAG: transposase [Chloroflexota bacterium]
MKEKVTRLDYCQFLISSQINYTLTYFADHSEKFSHDSINRYLSREKMTAKLLWEEVEGEIIVSDNGYVGFDDTVLDHNHSREIELVRKQWSGNAKQVIRGIGVVTCVYVNPELDKFWVIEYRLFGPEDDGKSKLEHVKDMLLNIVYHKGLPFTTVLMDTWYATRKLMRQIERLNKTYYCPIRKNRRVDDSDGIQDHQPVEQLQWSKDEIQHGKSVHLKDFPKKHRLKLFRLVLSPQRTDYLVTNDLSQDDTEAAQQVRGFGWKIEQFHRETKQVSGIEGCQCRKGRIQRNHIACSMLVWARLKQIATQTQRTIYQVKFGQLSDYLISQLKKPSISFKNA